MPKYSTCGDLHQIMEEGYDSAIPVTGGACTPPSNNMGVKNQLVAFHADYLRVTAWINPEEWEEVYDRTIGGALGDWVPIEQKGMFYQRLFQAALGARLYTCPSGLNRDANQITVQLPGKACQYLGFAGLQAFVTYLEAYSDRISITRLDLAFDTSLFSVGQFWEAANQEDCRTYARRDTFKYIDGPNELREDGQKGCGTVSLGKRDSLRYLRVYDKHGPTRVELELKDKKAHQVAQDLFYAQEEGKEVVDLVFEKAMGHLRDFVDVSRDWWEAFTAGIIRAYMQLTGKTAREIDVQAVADWLFEEVSMAFSACVDVYGEKVINNLLARGRWKRKKNQKYQVMLGDAI